MSNAHRSLESESSPEASPPLPLAEKPTSDEFTGVTPRRIRRLVAVVQAILFVAHWFLYETWVAMHPSLDATIRGILQIAFPLAAVSFVIASLLAWRYFNWILRAFYVISAVWIGLMSFCVFAAASCWIVLGLARLAGVPAAPSEIADGLF